jgi:hypothetical protein
MKLYLDTCCWCRPCDNHADKKVYDQAVAIMRIIRRVWPKGHIIDFVEAAAKLGTNVKIINPLNFPIRGIL